MSETQYKSNETETDESNHMSESEMDEPNKTQMDELNHTQYEPNETEMDELSETEMDEPKTRGDLYCCEDEHHPRPDPQTDQPYRPCSEDDPSSGY